jgi:hypothetical protein
VPAPDRIEGVPVSRRVVRVELGGNTATLSGPRLQPALELTGARWMWHPCHHRAVLVPRADLDDLLAALEMDGQLVEVVGRDGKPIATGGLLGGVA